VRTNLVYPACGDMHVHSEHSYGWSSDSHCLGWSEYSSAVCELINSAGVDAQSVRSMWREIPLKVRLHPTVLRALIVDLPDIDPTLATFFGLPVEETTELKPGEWQIIFAEGKIPHDH
jgi:hypothetical protein